MEEFLETAGLVLIVATILGRCWCSLYIAGRKKTMLVTHGPYSLCRNPLYIFNLFGAAGLGMISGSILVTLIFLGITLTIFDRVIRREEEYLEDEFGSAFQDYCQMTPRWLPRWSAWKDREDLMTKPRLILITLRDSSCLLLVWPLIELIQLVHEMSVIPGQIQLP